MCIYAYALYIEWFTNAIFSYTIELMYNNSDTTVSKSININNHNIIQSSINNDSTIAYP